MAHGITTTSKVNKNLSTGKSSPINPPPPPHPVPTVALPTHQPPLCSPATLLSLFVFLCRTRKANAIGRSSEHDDLARSFSSSQHQRSFAFAIAIAMMRCHDSERRGMVSGTESIESCQEGWRSRDPGAKRREAVAVATRVAAWVSCRCEAVHSGGKVVDAVPGHLDGEECQDGEYERGLAAPRVGGRKGQEPGDGGPAFLGVPGPVVAPEEPTRQA